MSSECWCEPDVMGQILSGSRCHAAVRSPIDRRSVGACWRMIGVRWRLSARRLRRGWRTSRDMDCCPGHSFDRAQCSMIGRIAKRYCNAAGAGTRGPADAVHIVLRLRGQIEVDDMRNAGHVDAARCDVGRDQHACVAAAKLFQRLLPRRLALVAVQRAHPNAAASRAILRRDRRNASCG